MSAMKERVRQLMQPRFGSSFGTSVFQDAWAFVVVAVQTVVQIAKDGEFTEDECQQIQDELVALYHEHIKPLDVPGPDLIVDRLICNMVIPGVVHAVHKAFAGQDGSIVGF